MRAAGIEPHTNTARFMMLSLPFACSCGGMGSLIGGGRCMASVLILYFIFRPYPNLKLPRFEGKAAPWTRLEKKTLLIIGILFVLWLTKGYHGIDYSVTGMLGVAALVLFGVMTWEDISEWWRCRSCCFCWCSWRGHGGGCWG